MMTRKVWVPTGNLAWRPMFFCLGGHHDRPTNLADYELVQEVVEVQINDGDEDPNLTGAVEWRPIPILPANPPPPTREDFLAFSTVVTNTEQRP